MCQRISKQVDIQCQLLTLDKCQYSALQIHFGWYTKGVEVRKTNSLEEAEAIFSGSNEKAVISFSFSNTSKNVETRIFCCINHAVVILMKTFTTAVKGSFTPPTCEFFMVSAYLMLPSPTERVRMERPTAETRASAVVIQCGASPSDPDLQNHVQRHAQLQQHQKRATACFWPQAWRTG